MHFHGGAPRFASSLPTSAADLPQGLRVQALLHTQALSCAAVCGFRCHGCTSIGLVRQCGRSAHHAQAEHTCASCWALPLASASSGSAPAGSQAKRCRVASAEALVSV
eukprot:4463359-Heterocapsa_arctica.AAC.1